jgi:hypothetical protein
MAESAHSSSSYVNKLCRRNEAAYNSVAVQWQKARGNFNGELQQSQQKRPTI